MKKILISAAAVIAASLALTGCSGNSASSNSSNTTTSSSSSSTTTSSSSESSSSESSESSTESSSSEDSGEESVPNAVDQIEFPDGRAGQLAKAAMSEHPDEWSGMLNIVSDQDMIDIYLPGLKLDMLEDYCLMFEMTGISGQELLLAKPKAGNESAVKEVIDARFKNIIDNGGFYPMGEETIAGAVSGVTDDGYYYIVSHAKGSDIVAAMTAAN